MSACLPHGIGRRRDAMKEAATETALLCRLGLQAFREPVGSPNLDHVPIDTLLCLIDRICIAHRLICPTGCLVNFVSSPVSKNISLRRLVETDLLIPLSRPSRGAYRDRHERGAGCGGRGGAGRAT